MKPDLEAGMLDLGIASEEALDILKKLEKIQSQETQKEIVWWGLVKHCLTKKGSQYYPFVLHLLLYKTIYPHWNKEPSPAWLPDEKAVDDEIHLNHWICEKGFKDYPELHQWSAKERPAFWQAITEKLGIIFNKPYSSIADFSKGIKGIEEPLWFKDAKINIANSCFMADKNEIAIIETDESGHARSYTYQALNELSNQISENLQKLIKKGDSVAIIMPMHFRAVAIYLGVIKAGAQVVSIAESFAADEIEARLKIANCHWIFVQDEVLREGKKLLFLEKLEKMHSAQDMHMIILSSEHAKKTENLNLKRLSFEAFLNLHPHHSSRAISCDPKDPINILFSSGTTGEPKAIPWNHTTPIKAASDAYFHHNIQPGDRLCWPSSLGWMMGPWAIFAALINKATLALYTGSPNGRGFGEFVQNQKISILGLVPTLVKHWRETACMEKLNWDAIKIFTSTGECSNPEDMLYLMYLAGYRPIIEYCGGTEIGGAYITGTVLQPSAPATFTTKAMGVDFVILDEEGKQSTKGEIAIIPPSIGLSNSLLNADHHHIYYEGMPNLPDGKKLRRHGDQAELFKVYPNHYQYQYYRLLGRVDDTMNLSGIKVSSAEVERILNLHPHILETAAVGIPEQGGGPEHLIVFAVLKQDARPDPLNLKTELQKLIKDRLNPLFKIQDLRIIEKLPRTASNKVIRRALKTMFFANNS